MTQLRLVSRVNVRYPFLWAMQAGLCFYCGRELKLAVEKRQHGWLATADHFYPKVYGHQRNKNVVLACMKCNTRSGHRMPDAKEIQRFDELRSHGNVWARRDVYNAPRLTMPKYSPFTAHLA